MKKILYFIIVVVFICFTGCSNTENSNENMKDNNVSKTSINEDTCKVENEEELIKALKDNYSVTLIDDITSDKVLVLEGNFSKTNTRDKNNITEIGRELNLYVIDDNNIISYTLTSPQLIIKSKNTTMTGGNYVGDIKVEAEGFSLDGITINGNIYLKNSDIKDSFSVKNNVNISGKIEIK